MPLLNGCQRRRIQNSGQWPVVSGQSVAVGSTSAWAKPQPKKTAFDAYRLLRSNSGRQGVTIYQQSTNNLPNYYLYSIEKACSLSFIRRAQFFILSIQTGICLLFSSSWSSYPVPIIT